MGFVAQERQLIERVPDPTPDPRAQEPIRVECLKAFYWNRRIVNPGERITITRWAADDLKARGRVVLTEERRP